MAIITISRGSYSRGKTVAEKVAAKLNYECISREILLEASEHFNIPEFRLIRALHDSPSIFDRFTHGKERFVAYIREALLKHVQRDNIVYHGLAGHFLLRGIPHVLKVRITADLEDRIKRESEEEKISPEEARHMLVKDDDERRKWSLYLYNTDTWDSRLYDLVVQIGQITVDDAVSIILHTVKLPCFTTTPEAQSILDDYLLSARVQAVLPAADVSAKAGVVTVIINAPLIHEERILAETKNKVINIEGIKDIRVLIVPTLDTG